MSQPKLAVSIQSWCNKVSTDDCYPSWFLVAEIKLISHLHVRNKKWRQLFSFSIFPFMPDGFILLPHLPKRRTSLQGWFLWVFFGFASNPSCAFVRLSYLFVIPFTYPVLCLGCVLHSLMHVFALLIVRMFK